MPKYYGMEFQVYPAGVYPTKAHTWNTLIEVKSQYELNKYYFQKQPIR